MQKHSIQQVPDKLPDEVDVQVLLDQIILLEKLEAAEQRLRAGDVVSHEDAKVRMAAWLE